MRDAGPAVTKVRSYSTVTSGNLIGLFGGVGCFLLVKPIAKKFSIEGSGREKKGEPNLLVAGDVVLIICLLLRYFVFGKGKRLIPE
jgi:hypothetical protein